MLDYSRTFHQMQHPFAKVVYHLVSRPCRWESTQNLSVPKIVHAQGHILSFTYLPFQVPQLSRSLTLSYFEAVELKFSPRAWETRSCSSIITTISPSIEFRKGILQRVTVTKKNVKRKAKMVKGSFSAIIKWFPSHHFGRNKVSGAKYSFSAPKTAGQSILVSCLPLLLRLLEHQSIPSRCKKKLMWWQSTQPFRTLKL